MSNKSIIAIVMAGTAGCGSITATLIANIVGAEDMGVGADIMVAAGGIATMIMTGIGIMIEITTKIMTATTKGITTTIETSIPWFATRPQDFTPGAVSFGESL
jgi:hypothetical protein